MQLPEVIGSRRSSEFDVGVLGVVGEFEVFTLTSFSSDSSGEVEVASYLWPREKRAQQLGEELLFCFCVEPME